MPKVARVRKKLTLFCPGRRIALFIRPCSLANATHEPENATEPMIAPSASSVEVTASCCTPRTSSIAAMPAAAPPPMPL